MTKLSIIKDFWRNTGIKELPKFIYYNYICKSVDTKSRLPIMLYKYCVLDFHKTSKTIIGNNLVVGKKHVKGSKKETRIRLLEGGRLIIESHYIIHAGSYIVVCSNSKLILHPGFMNENVQITCGDTIEIGEGTSIGRDVIIRSYDGHNIVGRAVSAPIHIGEHVWIGQRAMILKGVTIGDGAIIAAGAIVTKDIPPHCLAAGMPAKVIRENIEWE